jgi:hypothetical protein
MSKYNNVISLSSNRYTGIQASSGMSDFKTFSIKDREVAEFKILTNEVRVGNNLNVFISDMNDYCNFAGGDFEDRSNDIEILKEIIKKHTTITKTTYDLTASFECGPRGHGTISNDWTKFNPEICRKLENQELQKTVTWNTIDKEKVWEKYSNLPRFVCKNKEIRNKVIFIGTIHMVNRGSTGSFGDAIQLIVRLNQNISSPIVLDDNVQIY